MTSTAEYSSTETILSLAEYRQLAREGKATTEQLRRAVELMRGDRQRAQATSTKAKTAKAKVAADKNIDSDDLLSQLGNLT